MFECLFFNDVLVAGSSKNNSTFYYENNPKKSNYKSSDKFEIMKRRSGKKI